jgi:hypothetical protein
VSCCHVSQGRLAGVYFNFFLIKIALWMFFETHLHPNFDSLEVTCSTFCSEVGGSNCAGALFLTLNSLFFNT